MPKEAITREVARAFARLVISSVPRSPMNTWFSTTVRPGSGGAKAGRGWECPIGASEGGRRWREGEEVRGEAAGLERWGETERADLEADWPSEFLALGGALGGAMDSSEEGTGACRAASFFNASTSLRSEWNSARNWVHSACTGATAD